MHQPTYALQIRLFGQPVLLHGGEPVKFAAPPRASALLAYLLLHPGPLRRDHVAWALWPDEDEERARANLRRHLSLLQNTLPASGVPWLSTGYQTVAWDGGARASVDVHEFERLSENEQTRAEAVELYCGELAEGVDDEWLIPIRERLHDRQCANLYALAQACRERGDVPSALGYAQRLVRLDPWHEAGVRALIALRHASGDRAGALQEFRQFQQRTRDELGVEPMPETVAAYEAIRAGGEPANGAAPDLAAAVFPQPATSFYGREDEAEQLASLLAERRIITLCGPGGVGKTRLATEVALALRERFANGIRFVDLASLDAAAQVPAKIAFVLGIREQRGAGILDNVVTALRSQTVLLVVDNCEHVLDAAAACAERIGRECPQVRVLMTSRQPVGVPGEIVRRIEPLAVDPAVRLFLDRAADRHPGPIHAEEMPGVVRICRRLDGLPLALELAAALMGALSVETLAQGLDDLFPVAGSGSRSTVSRHRTLRATLSWSYDLLAPAEQRLFRRLAVFRGSFTPQGAHAVGAEEGADLRATLILLTSLVDKSMVVFHAGHGTMPRYRMFESARAYGLQRLAELGELPHCEQRHASFHRELAGQAATAYGTTADADWLDSLAPRNDDFQAALDWALKQRRDVPVGVDLAASLIDLWLVTGLESVGTDWLETATSHAAECDDRSAAAAWCGLGAIYRRAYRFGDAVDAARRAIDLYERLGDERALPRSLTTLGTSLVHRSPQAIGEGRPLVERALTIARRYADHLRVAEALFGLAIISAYGDDEPAAMRQFEEALSIFRNLGKTMRLDNCLLSIAITAYALGEYERAAAISHDLLESRKSAIPHVQLAAVCEVLGLVALERGDLDTAAEELRRALALSVDAQLPPLIDVRLANFALLHAARGDDAAAARYFGYVRRCAANGTWSAKPFYQRRDESVESLVRARLGEAAFRAAASEGGLMDRTAIVATTLLGG